MRPDLESAESVMAEIGTGPGLLENLRICFRSCQRHAHPASSAVPIATRLKD